MSKERKEDVQLGIHVHGTVVLNEASFKTLPFGNPDQLFETNDEILVSDVSLNGFKLRYSRKVSFSPSAFFEVLVVFTSDVSFDEEAGIKVLKDLNKTNEWIENNKIRIVNSFYFPAKSSSIISNLTEGAGFNPVITPPYYSKNK